MRVKKAGINVITNFITYFIGFLPVFIGRKVFLDVLGEELLGLSSLFTNIIGMLSIVELGIGTAIIFALYEPFAKNDNSKIKAYLNYYKKFYRIIGVIVLLVGILIMPLLVFFTKCEINIYRVNVYYFLFLLNTVVTYMFSYKVSLLYVSQQTYKVSIANTITKVTIAIVQIVALKIYASYIVYLLIQLILNCIHYTMINIFIDKQFAYLKTQQGTLTDSEKKALDKNVKSLFLHKLGGIFVLSTDNIVISYFLNLNIVAKYNSYNMIITYAQSVIATTLSSITSSIGNLLTEKNKENAYNVHKKMFFFNFWIAAFVTIALYNTLDQFIVLWLGKNQLLDSFTIAIVLLNFYFMIMRNSVESFKEAGGFFYQDRYSALAEAGVNLFFSIILVNKIGLAGVFVGTLISNLTVLFWVKPKIVYKYIFEKKLTNYFITYFKYFSIGIFTLIVCNIVTSPFKYTYTLQSFILNCLINIIVINGMFLIIFWRTEEFVYYKSIVTKLLKRNK